jgi:hypothetical protein
LAFLFSCNDQWGREVVLSDSRWTDHILPDHGEMAENVASVQEAIEQPNVVNFDVQAANGENFYCLGALPAPFDQLLLKVCVRFTHQGVGQNWRGEVITAYSTNREKQGEMTKWRR